VETIRGVPLDSVPAWAVLERRLFADIEDGWAALIDGDVDDAGIARHGRERGGKMFAAASVLLGATDSRYKSAKDCGLSNVSSHGIPWS